MWWRSSSVPEISFMHRRPTNWEKEGKTGLKWIQVFGMYCQLMEWKKMISWWSWWSCFLSFLLRWSSSVVVVFLLLLLLVCVLATVPAILQCYDSLHRHTHTRIHTFHSIFIHRLCWHISQFDCQLSIRFCSALWWKVAAIVAIAKSQRQHQPMTSNSRCCNLANWPTTQTKQHDTNNTTTRQQLQLRFRQSSLSSLEADEFPKYSLSTKKVEKDKCLWDFQTK